LRGVAFSPADDSVSSRQSCFPMNSPLVVESGEAPSLECLPDMSGEKFAVIPQNLG
jgi:hypothetical protein